MPTKNNFTGKEYKAQTDDELKALFRQNGIPIKKENPYGNEECTCGSGQRYDMCCSEAQLK